MVEPRLSRQIRPPDPHFIQCLREEMISNPTSDVAPIVAILLLSEGQEFNPLHAEAYQYETIGGNHSRIALQGILEDDSVVHKDLYSHRLVSVYHGLTDELAQHLAHRHNRATEFTNRMTTKDKVIQDKLLNFYL